jgi:hypothetical protein
LGSPVRDALRDQFPPKEGERRVQPIKKVQQKWPDRAALISLES